MEIKWTKTLQESWDRMMKNLQRTKETLSEKVSRQKKACEADVHPESSNA
jgi:hypothetical protein